MGIVGRYTMRLYCDHSDHPVRAPDPGSGEDAHGVYEGAGKLDAANKARAAGWFLVLTTGETFCPRHRPGSRPGGRRQRAAGALPVPGDVSG